MGCEYVQLINLAHIGVLWRVFDDGEVLRFQQEMSWTV
jgi:hypothetical protein